MYEFDATREDELNLREGDIVNVYPSVKTDEEWIWGECNGRSGVFPIAFAVPLSELGGIQEEHQQPLNNQGAVQPLQQMGLLQAVAIADYVAAKENHLSFRQGSIINLREKNNEWWTGELNGQVKNRILINFFEKMECFV
jgi:hypothetical protein